MKNVLYVALGGALGAAARYLLSIAIQAKSGVYFPWGTFTVNILGCLLIGLLWKLFQADMMNSSTYLLVVIGVLGGFTTFSSFGLDGLKLIEQQEIVKAGLYIIGTNIVGIGAVFVGFYAGEIFTK